MIPPRFCFPHNLFIWMFVFWPRLYYTGDSPYDTTNRVADPRAPYTVHVQTLRSRLQTMPPLIAAGLWPAQIQAIQNLETSLAQDRPRALIQMATGSGKTYTAVNFVYRLIKPSSPNNTASSPRSNAACPSSRRWRRPSTQIWPAPRGCARPYCARRSPGGWSRVGMGIQTGLRRGAATSQPFLYAQMRRGAEAPGREESGGGCLALTTGIMDAGGERQPRNHSCMQRCVGMQRPVVEKNLVGLPRPYNDNDAVHAINVQCDTITEERDEQIQPTMSTTDEASCACKIDSCHKSIIAGLFA